MPTAFFKAGYQGNNFKLRIPFPRRAEDRKLVLKFQVSLNYRFPILGFQDLNLLLVLHICRDVKTLIVEMLQAAKTRVD